MAEILEIPVETWKDFTGLEAGELEKIVNPVPPEGSKGPTVKGGTKTRSKSTPQDSDRRRINPGGRRADRLRKTDSGKKR